MDWINSKYFWVVRKVILLLVMTGIGLCAQAQTLEEWTKQKKLQTSYKLKQIAGLSAYLEVAKKGYEVARVGWNLVGDIQDGEFSLNTDYFGSLKAIHPMVSDYPIVLAILKVDRQIDRELDWMNHFLTEQKMMGYGDVMAVNKFNVNIEERSGLLISELNQVLTSSGYEMDDGERLAAIDGLYSGVKQLFQDLKAYNDRIRSLELKRKREEIQQQQVNRFYNGR
ncbi:hypothetical protein LV84_01370 [Algoriphagus ratkowskyi]|uniref:TerB family tellurite resistance protein n=1 Tax=Algoriphagus ratkowskyi TaxID=57028 RepID=A0A2W7RXM4_9BACT|nr:hypothetical protein [Algoriphagus ratkowskyi]PZX59339.1 hypothetical protein LV84_01370 [Algoriphagus ratkowskyi]TXD77395.1 hypothetical protein ESW18_11345 [Algoriphagus ratkowskyi]